MSAGAYSTPPGSNEQIPNQNSRKASAMGDKSPKAKDKAKSQHSSDKDAKNAAAKKKAAPPPLATPPAKKGK